MRFKTAACIALIVTGCTSKSKEPESIGPALAKQLYAGEVVFIDNCAACHKQHELAARPIVTGDKNTLLAAHPFDSLKDEDLASVLTFIRNGFGNSADMITIEDVKNFKNPPAKNQ